MKTGLQGLRDFMNRMILERIKAKRKMQYDQGYRDAKRLLEQALWSPRALLQDAENDARGDGIRQAILDFEQSVEGQK